MGKNDIVNHGTLHDSINYDALIKQQANTPSFLDSPKNYKASTSKKYDKPKSKRLILYKKSDK